MGALSFLAEVEIGSGDLICIDDFLRAFERSAVAVGKTARKILADTRMPKSKQRKVRLYTASVFDLGFSTGATTDRILENIKQAGGLCSSVEVALRLRLEYAGKYGDCLVVATEPIANVSRHHGEKGNYFFAIRNSGKKPCFEISYGRPAGFWQSSRVFVFEGKD